MLTEYTAKQSDVFYPCRTRVYPDGYYETLVASKPVFCESKGWEIRRETGNTIKKSLRKTPDEPDVIRACRRASANVRRLCHCAEMRYFVTLTLDAAKIDRYDVPQIIRKMSTWCDNQVRRKGLQYILVPERHKDGAIHFHGFFNNALPVVDSGTISRKGRKRPQKPRSKAQKELWLSEGGQVVYNLPAWTLGFTTAIELYGDKDKAISYTCKYLTKQQEDGKIGGRWYYHGGHFSEPETIYSDILLQDIVYGVKDEYYIFHVPEAGTSFGLKRGKLK